MTIYIVTLRGYDTLGDAIIKVFSTKENLDRWMELSDLMEKELYGGNIDPTQAINKRYKIKETTLDNLDFIDLLNSARQLGAQVKPSNPQ